MSKGWSRRGLRGQASVVKLHLARRVRAINGAVFIERDHAPDHSVLVLGSGRSGTTWLSESLARQAGSRLIFEPFHPIWTPGPDQLRLFLGPDARDPGMECLLERVLEGRTRKSPICDTVISRLPRGRVIKDIHTGNLLPWFRVRCPLVPIVYAVRHPIPTALSRQRIGDFFGLGRYLESEHGRREVAESAVAEWLPAYDLHRRDPDPVVRLVAEWCIENAYPLRCVETDGVKVSFYERAVMEPVAELTELATHCSAAIGGGGADLEREGLRRPSRQDQSGRIAAATGPEDWDRILSQWIPQVEPRTTRRCLDVLADFGLDEYYGAGPLPRAMA